MLRKFVVNTYFWLEPAVIAVGIVTAMWLLSKVLNWFAGTV